jgi:hypothetical protein
MADWQRQSRPVLGLAALLSLLLAQTAFSLPFRQTRTNLSPRMLYHNLGSLVVVALSGTRHFVDNLETLYELHQLAMGASRPEKPSVPVSLSSPPPSAQKGVCAYRGRFSSTGHC